MKCKIKDKIDSYKDSQKRLKNIDIDIEVKSKYNLNIKIRSYSPYKGLKTKQVREIDTFLVLILTTRRSACNFISALESEGALFSFSGLSATLTTSIFVYLSLSTFLLYFLVTLAPCLLWGVQFSAEQTSQPSCGRHCCKKAYNFPTEVRKYEAAYIKFGSTAIQKKYY